MDGFYGNQSLQKKGRMRGYDVNATAAYDNITCYVKEYPNKYLEMHINDDTYLNIYNNFTKDKHSRELDIGTEYDHKCDALLKLGEKHCPIKISEDLAFERTEVKMVDSVNKGIEIGTLANIENAVQMTLSQLGTLGVYWVGSFKILI